MTDQKKISLLLSKERNLFSLNLMIRIKKKITVKEIKRSGNNGPKIPRDGINKNKFKNIAANLLILLFSII